MKAIQADITKLDVDAIVDAARSAAAEQARPRSPEAIS